MTRLLSQLETAGTVIFPSFQNEKVYMREFRKGQLPSDLSRWQPTVDMMLDGLDFDGPAYLMVDQGEVSAGETHRRGGWHVDGYWNPGIKAHGGGHLPTYPAHSPFRRHRSSPFHSSGADSWAHAEFKEPEMLLLASDVVGCRAAVGEFEVDMKNGGDCSGVDVSNMQIKTLQPGIGYRGNVSLLHESIPLIKNSQRTVVRINVPGVTVH